MEEISGANITLVTGTVLVFLLSVFIIVFVIQYGKTQLKFKLERQQFQQDLLQTEIEIQQQTLSNVSQELHDNIGQIAALVKMNLYQLKESIAPENQQRLEESTKLVQQLISDVKNISSSLSNHQLLESGLAVAIKNDCKRIQNLGLLNLKVVLSEGLAQIDVNSSIFLYRMYQEITNNLLTHSQATEGIVELNGKNKRLSLKIKDNGIGFSPTEPAKGNGLENLKKRCATIGADLKITTAKNKGTEILIELDYPVNE